MKRKIKSCKKFISFLLSVMMIWSMGFTGVKASAATISYYSDSNNGDGSLESKTLTNTSEAQLMVRVGDIDNFGFGWPSDFNPFSGSNTDSHKFPFFPKDSDLNGTDRIMVVSGYNYNGNFKTTCTNRDGYTETTSRNDRTVYKYYDYYDSNSWRWKRDYDSYGNPIMQYTLNNDSSKYNIIGTVTDSTDNDNNVRAIHMTYTLGNISVQNATIQMFVDDFQPGAAHGISSGNVKYTATIAGKDGVEFQVPEISNLINSLDQSGPKGKLITFQIPERYLDLVRTGEIYIKVDNSVTGSTGDGYAIDFAKLLINKTNSTTNTATITGNVKDTNNTSIGGATVSAGGVVTATTDANGNYTLNNVPAGQAIVTASKKGYNSSTQTIPTVIAGGGYTANFTLTSSTPPTTPVIDVTPTTLTNTKVTATIDYSSDSTITIKQYRINTGGTTGEWKVYTGSFDIAQNCTIEAQGINQYGNESQIASRVVSNIDTTPPALILTQNQTNGAVTIAATASDNVAVASITKPDNTVVSGSSTTYTVSANGTYTFKSTDTAGNVTTQSVIVSNIDTTPPILTLTPSTTNPTSGTVTITAVASDNVAVASITTPDESIVEFNPAIQNNSTTYIVSANGTYTFKATDTEGNVTTQSITINNINRTGLSNQSIINSINTNRIAPNEVALGETFDVNYKINFNNQTLDDSKPNRQQWLACVKDNSNNMNYQMIDDVQAGSGTSRASVRDGIKFLLNKNNIKCNESYSFSNDSSGSSLSSRMNDALAAVTQKNSQGHERDIVIMIGTNVSDSELQNAIAVANNIKNQSDSYKLGINSIVINIGNKTGEENIKRLAGALGGNYIFLNNADEASKINNNYISQLAGNIADSYPLKNINFEDTYSDNFEAVSAPSFITIDNTNKKVRGNFYANYHIEGGQIKCDDVNFTITYRAVSYKDSSYIGTGVFNVVNNETDQKILERVPIQVIVPDTTPPTIALTPSTTAPTKDSITVTANITDNVGVTVSKWASGNQPAAYFASGSFGNSLSGNTFPVSENGTYTVYARDAAGNETVKTIIISNIDAEAPAIALTQSTTAPTKDSITVTANITDNVGVTVSKWASGNQPAAYFASGSVGNSLSGNAFLVSGNGTYTVYARDAAGNETVKTIIISNIDVEAPTIALTPSTTAPTKNSVTVTANIRDNIGVTASKWASGTQTAAYFASGSVGNSLSENTFSVSENGTYTVYARDAAGNETVQTITISNIDKIPPAAPRINTPENNTVTRDNTPTISGTAEANSTVNVYYGTEHLIGTVTVDADGNWTLTPATGLADGTYAIKATATDAAGNVSPDSDIVNIKIDSTGPTIVLTQSPSASTSTSGNVTITAEITDASGIAVQKWASGSQDISYFASGGTTFTGTTFNVTSNGTYTVYARDNVGNESVKNIVIAYSSILSHGIYSGKDNTITASNNAVAGIPVTLAMKVDIESSNPIINLKIDNTIAEGTIVFKKYLLDDSGAIDKNGTVQTLPFTNTGDITLTGLTTEIGKKYLITYTITPTENVNRKITLTATADGTSSVPPVILNLGTIPDLF